jgi:HSP20 family molecular chaperone IbpA
VRVRDARRRIALPDSVAGRSIVAAKLNEGVLEVVFEA